MRPTSENQSFTDLDGALRKQTTTRFLEAPFSNQLNEEHSMNGYIGTHRDCDSPSSEVSPRIHHTLFQYRGTSVT